MPTSISATPVPSSTSEAENENEYQKSEKLNEEFTQTRRGYSIPGTATKLVIASKL